MNKQEITETFASKLGVSKPEAERILSAFVELVMEALKDGKEVNISGFGSFFVSNRTARMGVNPQNPTQKIQIPAIKVPKFRAGKGLKEAVK